MESYFRVVRSSPTFMFPDGAVVANGAQLTDLIGHHTAWDPFSDLSILSSLG